MDRDILIPMLCLIKPCQLLGLLEKILCIIDPCSVCHYLWLCTHELTPQMNNMTSKKFEFWNNGFSDISFTFHVQNCLRIVQMATGMHLMHKMKGHISMISFHCVMIQSQFRYRIRGIKSVLKKIEICCLITPTKS